MNPPLYDAHNHLQDERLGKDPSLLIERCRTEGIAAMVVNGSCEEDWEAVLRLSQTYPEVIPSFGYHPWYVRERSGDWKSNLVRYLYRTPSAIGEVGLDRWIKDADIPGQEETFQFQLQLAASRNLPLSIHCLQAWGRMYDLLRNQPGPDCGFLLHSYGGPVEMVEPLAALGAYFSLPGYYANERKAKQRDTFKHVPLERLLIETDAPDQLLPPERSRFPLQEIGTGKNLNHPANLPAVYDFAAELLGIPMNDLAARVEENFLRLFGSLIRARKSG